MNHQARAYGILVSSLAMAAVIGFTVLLAPSAGFAQQAPPRKAPVRKAPAKTATTPAPAKAQPQYKGIWEPVNYSEDLQLTDIFCVSVDVCYVAGAAGTILKTTDGGANWTVQLGGDPQSQDRAITRLKFLDERTGWARQSDKLLRTTDGETWELAGPIDVHAHVFSFTSLTNGVFLSYGNEIFHTRDGGRTWKHTGTCQARAEIQGLMRNVVCEVNLLQFVSPTVGFAVGYRSDVNATVVMKTEDGGESWNAAGVLPDASSYNGGVFFLDENTGVLATYSHQEYRTTDGGQTWEPLLNARLGQRIRFADPEVGWAVDRNVAGAISFTTDGGLRWTTRMFTFPAIVLAFSLPRRDVGYVVGQHGMIYRYRVVPATEEVAANVIPAPAMAVFDSPLDEQVEELTSEVQELEASVAEAAEAAGVEAPTEPFAAAPEEGGEEGEEESAEITGWAQDCCGPKLQKLQSILEAVSSQVPQFTGKYRNLNLAFSGVQVAGQMFSQAQTLKDTFRAIRRNKDPQAVMSAVGQLTSVVQSFRETTRQAFQKPPEE